ncbi:MAG: ABC transporter ATP-binding protein [Acidobacteriia bacterium]|nr:ABC transporter ATP-binding protein [Terriglobia bacterium]
MILAREVTKLYGRHRALSRVSFEVHRGEVVGLIGPNGAGKTTLLSVLMGFLRIQSGEVQVLGQPLICGRSPARTFLVADHPAFYGFLSPRKHLVAARRLMGRKPDSNSVEEILERVGLLHDADRKISEFSRGMAQRMGWAVAMLAQPAILLMDEPTSALDPGGVIQLREVVEEFAKSGTTVLFSSHTLPEVERLCSRVLFLKHGELTPASNVGVFEENGFSYFEARVCTAAIPTDGLLQTFADEINQQGNYLRFRVRGHPTLAEIAGKLELGGISIFAITDLSHSMERSLFQTVEVRHE